MSSSLIKIALIGDGAVGKTALRERFIGREFKANYLMTIGADFATYKTTVDGKEIKFQIWDLAGQQRFESVRTLYYRGTMGALMVYDVTRAETFQNTPKWIEECFKHSGKGSIPL
ncbi:MAG: GTP-binding protein, partial [Candidatus Hodarchaeales archaeon]